MAKFYKVHAMGPDPCPECEDMDGEEVTKAYFNAHTHPNCKCVLTPVNNN